MDANERSDTLQLAQRNYAQANFSKAERLYKQIFFDSEKELGARHQNVGSALLNLGMLYRTIGQLARAEECYKKARLIFEESLGIENPNVAITVRNLAEVTQALGHDREAQISYLSGQWKFGCRN